MNWKDAFLKQSYSDYDIFQYLQKSQNKIAFCHQLHYLQMATEKFAKAQLCIDDDPPGKMTHFVLVKYLQTIKGRSDIKRRLGFQYKNTQFQNLINQVLPIAKKIEELAPSGTNNPNPEYPWEDVTNHKVISPLEYDFHEFGPQNKNMPKFISLFSSLIVLSDNRK
jgi:hypothetical protein